MASVNGKNVKSTYQIGRQGEDIAVAFLQSLGWQILGRNYVYHKKEIDIIAKDKNTIVFVEVKERSTDYFGEPYVAVDKQKQRSIIMVADNYIKKFNIDLEARFDIISIVINEGKDPAIKHIIGAFEPSVL